MTLISIHQRKMTEQDWMALKNIRLESLQRAKGVFGRTYEQEFPLSDQEWKDRLTSDDTDYFGAFINNSPVGMAGLFKMPEPDLVLFGSLYVQPAYRRRNVSNLLFRASITGAQKKNYTRMQCNTREDNQAVIALCDTFGFKYSHRTPRTWPDNTDADCLSYFLDL